MAETKHILAIESSGRHSSLATMLGEPAQTRLIGQTLLSGDERTAQVLAPTIKQLLESANWSAKDIDLVAVAAGPGSFTGLRIGITTAKAFAYAVGAEIVGVNTLESLALQAMPAAAPVWTILDAQRQELFAAKFVVEEQGIVRTVRETFIVGQDAWLADLETGDRVLGPALKRLVSRLPNGVEMLPEPLWQPTAAAVGQIAWQQYQAGHRDDVWKLAPNYYRLSAAEEKRMR
jgi:tRNA threonylcarbamoyladenosine biosynthesis protein TsaB